MGDFTKIGQFGVGFKYWWRFFERVEVIVDDGEYQHNLSVNGDFKPSNSEYNYNLSDNSNTSTTMFRFTKPKMDVKTKEVKWVDYIKDEAADIYGNRVFLSLPFIQSRTGGDFEIKLKSPTTDSKLFCKLIESKKCGTFDLDTIQWGRTVGSEREVKKNFRVTTTLDTLKSSDKDIYQKFRTFVIVPIVNQ